MFRPSLFANDPFFSSQMEGMRQMEHSMDAMMTNLMDPFGFFGGPMRQPTPAIGYDGYSRDYDRRGERQNSRQLQQLAQRQQRHPGGMFDLFGGFGMMPNMHNMLQQQMLQAQTDPNASYYSQSTVMSYQNTGDGQPRIYQASTSQGQSNGVKEVRKSVRDSAKGVEKMTVAREMGEKSQVITKQRNAETGGIEEEKELVNLDEEEEDVFNSEFRQKMSNGPFQPPHRSAHHRMVAHRPEAHQHHHQQAAPLALEAPRHESHRPEASRHEMPRNDPRRYEMERPDARPQSSSHHDVPRRERTGARPQARDKKASPKKQKSVRF